MIRAAVTFAAHLVLLAGMGATRAAVVEPGHSALWYDPARDGQGLMLEIHANDGALLTWYTYDEDGNQRWLIGEGSIVRGETGEHIEFPELIVTHGGRFGPDFDPDQVVRTVAGSATLAFQDCYEGVFSYDAFQQQGELALHRLTHTMAAGCRPIHGMTGEPVYGHAGQSGAWYDPAHDGEGWFLQWMAHNEAVITWYTYDDEGNQAWLLGTGTLDGDGVLVFDELRGTRGAHFGNEFDPADVEPFVWGRLELAIDCVAGAARYHSELPQFGTGDYGTIVHLSRLAAPAGCPWVAPGLTDLYDIQVTELPVTPQSKTSPPLPGSAGLIFVTDVADDGTVAGKRRDTRPGLDDTFTPLVLRPGEDDWRPVADDRIRGTPRLSADGSRLLVQLEDDSLAIVGIGDSDGGLVPVPGLAQSQADTVADASDDLALVLGSSRMPREGGGFRHVPWLGGGGQAALELPPTESHFLPVPRCLSNDGSVVIGDDTPTTFPSPPTSRLWTMRWLDGGTPEILLDNENRPLANPDACSRDGKLVFGWLVVERTEGSAYEWPIRPGFIRDDGLGAHLDLVLDPDDWTHVFADASADGSLVAGNHVWSASGGPDGDIPPVGVFLWTQDTGQVLLAEWLADAGLEEAGLRMRVRAVSPNGRHVLLGSDEVSTGDGGQSWLRAALVSLTPK